ncbi:MAG: hypothetical protein DRP16_05610, partial [Candidatus Aenigmatarchaeota archaeon]
ASIDQADTSAIGGFSSVDGALGLESGSRPLAVTRQDYQDLYDQAKAWLQDAVDYRQSELQFIEGAAVTTIDDLLQNYMDKNDGELYDRFCADYEAIDEQGYCPEGDPAWADPQDIRNKLIWSRDAFAALAMADPADLEITTTDGDRPARELGREKALEATREIANIHLIFGNEFLIDALDTRLSGADSVVGADTLVVEEIRQLDLARQQIPSPSFRKFRLGVASGRRHR